MHTMKRDAGRGGLEDRRRRGLGRHGDERRGRAGGGDRVGDGVEHRDALDVLAALARRDAADDLRAVGPVAQAVVLALPAGEALDDDLGVGVDEDGHAQFPFPSASATAARAASSMVGLRGQLRFGDAGVGQDLRGPPRRWCRRGGSRSAPAGRRGRSASTMPLATSSPRVMPPKMLMKMLFTFWSKLMTSSAAAITSALAPPPMSRKLAAVPPTWLTTSSVLIARPAPLAMMPTVPSRPMYCRSFSRASLLALVELLGGPVLVPLGMAERGVVVEADLGVEGVHLAVGPQDQRVDLGQVAVALGEAAVQLDEDVGGAVDRLRRSSFASTQPGGPSASDSPSTGLMWSMTMASGFVAATASISTPPSARQHQQVLLGGAVERERGVVLLGDVGGVLDPHPLDDVALDVHAEDVAGVRADLVGVVGELDAAGLAAPAHLHLGLDDDRVPGGVGLTHRLVDGVGHTTRRHRDVVAGEVLLALVLEQIHLVLLAVQRRLPTSALMPFSELPGPKISATPWARRHAVSASGMTPPPKTNTSSRSRACNSLMTRGNSVRCAPHNNDRPTASASSCKRGLGNLLRRLVQAGVDHLETVVAQCPA